jgi:hypothetical protein
MYETTVHFEHCRPHPQETSVLALMQCTTDKAANSHQPEAWGLALESRPIATRHVQPHRPVSCPPDIRTKPLLLNPPHVVFIEMCGRCQTHGRANSHHHLDDMLALLAMQAAAETSVVARSIDKSRSSRLTLRTAKHD